MSTITSLEDLVQVSIQAMDSSHKQLNTFAEENTDLNHENKDLRKRIGLSDEKIGDRISEIADDLRQYVH